MKLKFFFVLLFLSYNFLVFCDGVKDIIAVPNFYTNMKKNDIAIIVTENFIEALTKSNHYTVVERSSINKVFNEQNMSNSEDFNQSKAIKIGELIGANIVVIGSVNFLNETYFITVKGIDVEKGTIKFSENIQTKNLKMIPSAAKEIGYSISFYGENSNKAFDLNIGFSFTIASPFKFSKRLENFYVSPLWPDFGLFSAPLSFTYFASKKVSIGATFSPGVFISFVPVIIANDFKLFGFAIMVGTIDFKLLFRLKAEQAKKNYKFVFETGLKSDISFLYDPLKQFSTYHFGLSMGPLFSFGVENRKNANFSLEYNGFLSATFDVIPFDVYSTSQGGFGINITIGMEIRFGYYNLFPKYEKRLGIL